METVLLAFTPSADGWQPYAAISTYVVRFLLLQQHSYSATLSGCHCMWATMLTYSAKPLPLKPLPAPLSPPFYTPPPTHTQPTRSAGHTGVDPDPRQRPDTDPAAGLRGLLAATPEAAAAVAAIEGSVAGPGGSWGEVQGGGGGDSLSGGAAAVLRGVVMQGPGGSSSRPVHKDDFAMGGVAMPALTGELIHPMACVV
jgi:hypothetical protein